jgi:hypothetical protein
MNSRARRPFPSFTIAPLPEHDPTLASLSPWLSFPCF